MPWIFRHGGCDRALICLAVNGPLTVRELGRAIDSDSHTTWDIVERLREAGMVVKRDEPGGRKYVALNRRLPIYRPLRRLLLAPDRYWPATRDGEHIARWRMPFDSNVTTERMDHIFQSPVRSRVLLFVAAVGECDMKTIYDTLGMNSGSVTYVVNHWEKQGVFRSRIFKRHRLVSLDPGFIVAKELTALLREIVVRAPEYRGLRAAVRPKMRALLNSPQKQIGCARPNQKGSAKMQQQQGLRLLLAGILLLERQRLVEFRDTSLQAIARSILIIGSLFILCAIIFRFPADDHTALMLAISLVLFCGWSVRVHIRYYLTLAVSFCLMPFPPAIKTRAMSWYTNVVSGIDLFWHFAPVLFAAGVTTVLACSIASKFPLSVALLDNFSYPVFYIAVMTVSLTFPAMTIAINVWKQSAVESRLIAQAGRLRDEYFKIADALETAGGETSGTISMKGIAETLNDAIYNTAVFDIARLEQWVQSLIQTPEVKSPLLKPWLLIGTTSIKEPFVRMKVWQSAIAGAVNYAVYAAFTCIGLIVSSKSAENVYGLMFSIAVLAISLRATIRLVAE